MTKIFSKYSAMASIEMWWECSKSSTLLTIYSVTVFATQRNDANAYIIMNECGSQ